MVGNEEHSPVYKTMQALEDQGLHVAVAYHHKRPGPLFDDMIDGQARIDQWTHEAFEDGAQWVSVIVVSDRPVKERLTAQVCPRCHGKGFHLDETGDVIVDCECRKK